MELGCHLALLGFVFFSNRRRDSVHGPRRKDGEYVYHEHKVLAVK